MSEDESADRSYDGEEEDLPSERRGDTRHLACFPAYVEAASGEEGANPRPAGVPRSALIRDLSV